MAEVYGNGLLTLAAADYLDCNSGLFKKPFPVRKGKEIEGIRDLGLTQPLSGRTAPEHNISKMALLQLSWVYQERLLSPRVLYYGRSELVWECNSMTSCQCNSDETESLRIQTKNGGLVGLDLGIEQNNFMLAHFQITPLVETLIS